MKTTQEYPCPLKNTGTYGYSLAIGSIRLSWVEVIELAPIAWESILLQMANLRNCVKLFFTKPLKADNNILSGREIINTLQALVIKMDFNSDN